MVIKGDFFKSGMACKKCRRKFGANDEMITIPKNGDLLEIHCPLCYAESENHLAAVARGEVEFNGRVALKQPIAIIMDPAKTNMREI